MAKRIEAEAVEVVSKASAVIPAPPTVDNIADAGGLISWIEELRSSIQLAKTIVDQCRDPANPGRIRLVRQALQASEHLGRCLERAAKLSYTASDINSFERFNQAMIEEIMKEDRPLAQRVLGRLGEWLGRNYAVQERRRPGSRPSCPRCICGWLPRS